MVADLNLLGSVGDMYCFSNTLIILVFTRLFARLLICKLFSGLVFMDIHYLTQFFSYKFIDQDFQILLAQ